MDIKQSVRVAVDAIIFTYTEGALKVLLVQQRFGPLAGKWVLVGGFVKEEESLTNAVHRELEEESGLKVNYLEQLYTFGDDIHRDPRFRVISVSYFALISADKQTLRADTDAQDARWFDMKELPELGYDHAQIINVALKRLKAKLTYQPVGFDLLPEFFPFSDLENLYCSILGQEIDRRNFRKKMLSFGIIEDSGKKLKRNFGRPAQLFTFNQAKYHELVKEGFFFEIKFA